MLALLRERKSRGFSAYERSLIAEASADRPSIDLEILFEYNSAEITERSLPTLEALAAALKNPALADAMFILGGHTDAKGGAAYNQSLSERRAASVRTALIERFGVPEAQLWAIGYGKEQLKNAANPLADENRRVQVVNFLQR